MKLDRLQDVYADPGPFASALVEVSRAQEDGDRLAELAARGARDALVDSGAPASVADQVAERIAAPTHEAAPVSRFVVATERGVLVDALTHRHHAQPVAEWSALPDVASWLEDETLLVPHILVVVDHEGGSVTTFRSDPAQPDSEAEVRREDPHEHKFHGGGWSHLRFQHNTENVWFHRMEEVAAEVVHQLSDGPDLVVVAGDPQVRPKVLDALGDVRAQVATIDGGNRSADGGDEALEAAVLEVLREQVISRGLAELHELRDRMGKGARVATGIGDVAEALVRGQVDRLYLDPDAAAGFELDLDSHPGLSLGAVTCHGKQRADRALVAGACLTDADVVVAPIGRLAGTPAAAILRWDQ